MPDPRYLTKSRFKLASECETKLFYTRKKEYADQSSEDPFLRELARGGYQVGELAKYYITDNPAGVTVKETGYDEALTETLSRIARGDRYIAEAAVRWDKCFIRIDILEIDVKQKRIKLYEVKSVSWKEGDEFFKTVQRGEKKGQTIIDGHWMDYLLDVAFQKYVVSEAYPDYSVEPFLVVVNKDATASVNGLNQFFRVRGEGKTHDVIPIPGLTREMLGDEVLITLPVTDEVEFILNEPVESEVFPGYSFPDYVRSLALAYENDTKLQRPVSEICKKCQFYTKDSDSDNLRSGRDECWAEKVPVRPGVSAGPKVIELWGGKAGARSVVRELIGKSRYFLADVDKTDISDSIDDEPSGELTPAQRRWEQVRRVRLNDTGFYLDLEGLSAEMAKWRYPLHFIDFETSSPALPFTRGAHPYEGIAFQYSHHIVRSNDGGRTYTIEHRNQFLNTDRGTNPNLAFLRELMRDLSEDDGTIFRYHNHENTYLRMIGRQLGSASDQQVPDKRQLLAFIDSITQFKDGKNFITGPRNMVDLWDLVLRFYYSPHALGSNSLKQILPAAINDSPFLRDKYSRPVCGRGREVTSLNFESVQWIDERFRNDPYKTLPPVFEGYSREELDEMFDDMDELADGGAAMMAYAKLQFWETSEEQREMICKALYKYCELDTLAMVMLWEYWLNEIKKQHISKTP